MKTVFQYRFYVIMGVVCMMLWLANQARGASRTASVTGNWNNTATWGGAAVPTSSDDITINAGITVTMNVAGYCSAITSMGNGSYIIGSNSITLQSVATITIPASVTATISCPIAGVATSLTIIGSSGSSLNISGSNTYTGTTFLTGNSSVYISNATAFGSGSVDLPVNNGIYLTANISVSNPITDFGGLLGSNSSDATWAGTITTNSANPPTLYGYSGFKLTVTGTVTLSSQTLSVTGPGPVIISGKVTGTNSIYLSGGGSLTLSGANDFSGGILDNNRQLNINSAAALGTGTFSTYLNPGLIDNTSGADITISTNNQINLDHNITFKGTNSLNLGPSAVTLYTTPTILVNNNTLTIGGTISGGYGITKAGNGALTLSGASTFTGGTTLSSGTLNINNAGSGGTSSSIGTGAFTINGGTIDNTSGSPVTLSTNNPITIGANFAYGGSNNLSFGTGAITNAGSRTITLNGTSKTLTFGGKMTNGVAGTQITTVDGSGNTFVLGAYDLSNSSTSRNGTFNGTGNVTISGIIANGSTSTGSTLTYSGSGILSLSGTNTYAGGTTLSSGTLELKNAAALGAVGQAVALNGGVLDLDTDVSVNAYNTTIGGNVTIESDKATTASAGITHTLGTLSIGANTLTINKGTNATGVTAAVQFGNLTLAATATLSTGTANLQISGTASGNFKLTKSGSGTLQKISAGWSLDNDFQITAGTYTANGQTTTIAGLATVSGGEYQAKSGLQTFNGGLTLSGGTFTGEDGPVSATNVTITSGTFTAPTSAGSLSVSGDWTRNGALFTPNGGTVSFNSTSADQNINGTATTQAFNNLTVSKSSKKLIIGGSITKVTVGSTLTMTSGNIDCGSSNTLELGTTTTSVGTLTYTAGNILGNFKRWVSATGTGILFPVGTAADNRKALVTFTNLTSGSLTGKFIASDPGSTGLPLPENSYGIAHQFTEGYWSLIAADALASSNYALELTGTNFTSLTEDANVRIIKRPSGGGSWSLNGSHVAGVAPTAKRSGLSGFSEFGHGRAENCLTAVSAPTPSTQTVCNNTIISSISVTPTGGTALTYQWYSNSTNNNSTGTSLGSGSNGEQTATYTPPATTTSGTTYYYCVVSQPGCNSIISTTTSVTVKVSVTYGSVASGDQTICYNGIPSSMSVSGGDGSGSFSYQWYSKSGVGSSCPSGTSTSGWSSLGTSNGANTATYTPAAGITSSITFACFVTPGGSPTCGTATWATGCRKVTVNSNFTSGAIATTNQTICYNGDPSVISSSTAASGGDGTITYQWQKSTTSSSSGFADISSTNSESYDPPASLTVTTWYRRQAHDGTCNTGFTTSAGVWQVTVRNNFTSGTIPSTGETICYNGNPGQIGSTSPASGGDESITYRWQSSTDSGFTSPTDISSNTETYDPPTGLTVSTWYRRQAKEGTCNTTFTSSSGVWKVTVHNNFTAGEISATSETICYNGDPSEIGSTTLASGGDGTITYRWQSSDDDAFTSPTNISSNTATYNPPTGLIVSTWYRRQAKDGTCNTTFTTSTGVWKVTVYNNFTAGEIATTSETICYNGDPAQIGNLTPSRGGDGSITYHWQSSTDADFTSPTTISSSNSATYNPPANLTTTTWYRRQAHDGTCNTGWETSTGTWKVTVYNNFTPGAIETTGETICYNGNPTQIGSSASASGGNSSITYEWESSTDGFATAGSLISGAISATYDPPAGLIATTSYRRYAKDGTCNTTFEVSTGTWVVTVRNNFNPGAIETTGETICYNGNPAQIGSSTPASGGDASITYKWESSTDGFATAGSLISGATSATYDPPTGLAATTSYRRYAKDGTCNTTFEVSTGTWVVTVHNNFTSGEIETSGETICYSGNPASIGSVILASGGDESITYTWQRSTTSSLTGYSDITSSNSAAYDPPANLTETTWYRRQAKDGTCNTTPTSSTGVWKVTVYAEFTAGAIETTGESICYSGNPVEIGSSTVASGGNESITYQWQSSLTSNFASPTNINSSNSSTYNPPTGLIATTWYRRQAKDGACNTNWNTSTGTWKVTVVDPDAPTGPATQTYCSAEGKTITDLTATLVSGINIKWYSASTGGTQYQNSDVLVSRSYFASQTNGDGCESTTRKEVAVTINANPNLAGLSTTPTNVCQEDPSVVTVSATSLPNGTYTVNYTLTGDNAQGATDIQMTVTGGTNSGTFSTPDLTTAGTTTVTINSLSLNSCPTTATAGNTHAITITATGTWLGTTSTSWNTSTNWCGGVPGSSTNVVVPSAPTNQPHVDITNAVSNNLTVNSGAVLTIDAAKALTVNGTLTNSAGNNGLILKSDGTGTSSLVHTTASVPATVERYISGAAEAWHFLSSPVASQSISGDWIPSGTYGNGTGYDLYVWDEVTRCWIYKLNTTTTVNWNTVHSQGNFVPGRGYLYSVQATNPTKSFGGNLNNGSYDYPITLTSDTNRLKGFNLVGNPYPSSVDWQATSGWGRSNLVGGNSSCNMWVWSPSAGNYGLCSSSGGSGTNGVTRYIAPMQGFFVQAVSSGNLGFSNSVRVHNEASDWKSVQINSDTISVIVQSESDQTADEVRILFGYPANETGAAKLFSPIATAPSLYLAAGKENYTVRYLTDTIAYPHVPLQFKAGSNGYYTLSFNFETAAYKNVLLEDRKTKQIQDLKIESTYRFNASTTDAANRFVIHFVPVKPQEKKGLPAKIYTDGTHILVDLTKLSGDSRVQIYNVIGQKLYEQQLAGETQHTLNFNPESQLLIIKLQNPMGQLVRKILCNNTYR